MRIHEILGVEPMQVNTFRDGDKQFHFYVDWEGNPRSLSENSLCAYEVCLLINYPEQIIRTPKLTDEQKELLKALVVFEGYWLCKEEAGGVFAYREKPTKQGKGWRGGGDYLVVTPRKNLRPLLSLVSWDDEKPFDIEQTLRDAGEL